MSVDSPSPAASPSLDAARLIARRSAALDVSGIRRAFELGKTLADPINLSIGQPDFPVPEAIKQGAIDAIKADRNGYTLTQGADDLRASIERHLAEDVGWTIGGDTSMCVTSGTSGGLLAACLALLDPGDEIIIPDPYFVMYPALAEICGATAVFCDTYPDMRMTADRVAACITPRTKMVLLNSPGNPSGVVLDAAEVDRIAAVSREAGVVLVSDEIYDAFTYTDAREDGRCPSPARNDGNVLLVRGFGKTYGCTGWRLGWAAGPTWLIHEMLKLQQYTFVCAPSMAQAGAAAAFDVDMEPIVSSYARKRDMVLDILGDVTEVPRPGGAFYAFVEVPPSLGMSDTEFCEEAIRRNVIVIPGSVFSQRSTHFRISYATSDEKLERGLRALRDIMTGG
ncbi:MAG: pyridoxal phosphate-dependent aminotransferase [Phycisphaerales bacterium]